MPVFRSFTCKLMLVFFLVAVPPMLLASKLTSSLVNEAVNRNVERWMRNTANYITMAISDTKDELAAIGLLVQSRFTGPEPGVSPNELRALADFTRLTDAQGNVRFSTGEQRITGLEALYPGSPLSMVHLDNGRTALAIVDERPLTAWDGSGCFLALGNFFTIELSEGGTDEPITFQLFLPGPDGYRLAYSSGTDRPVAAPETFALLEASNRDVFLPDKDWTDGVFNGHILLRPVRGADGEIAAVFAVGVNPLASEDWLPSSGQVFWGMFVLGTLFSGCAGYVLARRIVRPIGLLSRGVQNIADGDLGHRLPVQGADEIAMLGLGFNQMAEQLEANRHRELETARQERTRMLGEIALGFAHEIRNPLVVIKTSAEVLRGKLNLNDKDARLMGFVAEEVGRIDSLVSEFLAFAHPLPVSLEDLDLEVLADDALTLASAELERRQIRSCLVNTATDTGFRGDRNQLRQVLLNLLFNAMDAMPGGGTLELRLREDDQNRLCLEVRDNGSGIPSEILPTIFQPFMSTKKNGVGLGLAKTRAIVEAHGGRIACVSQPGQGTVFTVSFPRQTSE